MRRIWVWLACVVLLGGAMIPKTFDGNAINDGSNYRSWLTVQSGAYGLPQLRTFDVRRSGRGPLVGGVEKRARTLALRVEIVDWSNYEDLYDELMGWFDTTEAKALVVTDGDGSSRERYVDVVPRRVVPLEELDSYIFTVLLQVHGDLKFRSVTEDSETWYVTASGQTKVVNNAGEADALPVLTLRPTSGNASGFAYKRWMPTRWRADGGATGYPVELTDGGFDTAALVTAGKAQSDGDDFRIEVDGSEVDRWFGTGSSAFNQAATKVWVNLDWDADVGMTLKTAIASSGTVDSVEVNEAITALPGEGILLIGSEAFVYASKSDATKTFNNVTRAAKGTSMGAHSVDDDVWWIQHDIWLLYGDPSASAPSIDDDYEPAFELDLSSNGSWVYEEFGEDDGKRTGAWVSQTVGEAPAFYNGNQGAAADPWIEIGIATAGPSESLPDEGRWSVHNPCGITNANFTNGQKYVGGTLSKTWVAYIQSSANGTSWVDEYTIADPSVADAWETWNTSQALDSGSKYAALYCEGTGPDTNYLEAADCTLTLNSSYTPTLAFTGGEQGNYVFLPVILNQTTGESISIEFNTDLNEDLEIDTEGKTVVDGRDGSSAFGALTVVGDPRAEWLALGPGNNTLQYTDAGTGNVTVVVEWRKRWR